MAGSRLNFSRSLDFVGDVAAGGNPRVHVDGGVTIDEIVIHTNLKPNEFKLVVELDGDLRVKLTGQQLLDREGYDSRVESNDQYVFSFSDSMAKTVIGEMMTGMATQVSQRVEVSLEISENVEAASPFASLYLEASENRPEEYRLYVVPETVKITQAGENDYDGFRKSRGPGHLAIRRVYFYGAVSKLRIEQDERAVFGKRNLEKAINDARLLRNGKTIPAGCFVYDPIVKASVALDTLDLFVTQTPTRATLTTTNTTDVQAIVEYVEDIRVSQAA